MKTTSIVRASLAFSLFFASSPLAAQAQALGAPDQGAVSFVVFRADSPAPPPSVRSVLGAVSGHLCRRPWDVEATDSEALAQIKEKARSLGANGLVDVKFDRDRTELKSACWQKVTVTGTAVVFTDRQRDQVATPIASKQRPGSTQ